MAKARRSMRERVTIQYPEYTYSSGSYGQKKIADWTDVKVAIPASFVHTGGTETYHGRQLEANVIGVFEVRLPKGFDIKSTSRIVHLNDDNKVYEIVSARPLEGKFDGGFRFMEVFVRALADV